MEVGTKKVPETAQSTAPDLQKLIDELTTIRDDMVHQAELHAARIEAVHPSYRDSAANLVHYLAMRTYDVRKLQKELSQLALSSFGHSEGYALANISNVLGILRVMKGLQTTDELLSSYKDYPLTADSSAQLLKTRTRSLFGKLKRRRQPAHIMVTMPTEAATDYNLVRNMLRSGMDIARINLGHDDVSVWEAMIANIHRGMAELDKRCRIYCDLSGPKLRTGPISASAGSHQKKKKKKKGPAILLFTGDHLFIQAAKKKGTEAVRDAAGKIIEPARISVSIPSVLEDVNVKDRVWFDDGKLGGRVIEKREDGIMLEIRFASVDGASLRAEKGVNLPNSVLKLPSLTEEDKVNLPFVARNADIIGYSFVRAAADVKELQDELKKLDSTDNGIVLKIETREAFSNLPDILFQAMESPNVGVMIARGDLAVEVGFERISELQDQILWLSEAAHLPTIWATQVLETLAKKGRASRAEITDVAHAVRAECVMLNKGPYINEAIRVLGRVLTRMSAHKKKKKDTLRRLRVAKRFLGEG